MDAVLGLDTSCYTTSAALAWDGAVIGQKRRDPHPFLERGGIDYLTSCDVPFRHAHLDLFAAKTLERLGARRIDLCTRILQVHKHADSA